MRGFQSNRFLLFVDAPQIESPDEDVVIREGLLVPVRHACVDRSAV
ncbi:MAG: hypothetical protein OSB10_12125 [Planctomycetota bacterium]|nr:hypothetical protein [Planctomycetota bacterium]